MSFLGWPLGICNGGKFGGGIWHWAEPRLSLDSLFAAMGLTSPAAKCTRGNSLAAAFEKLLTLPRVFHCFASSAIRGEWSGAIGATCAWTFREGMACVASTCCLASTPLSKVSSYAMNPCGVGRCVNDGKGAYSCICPPNYIKSTTVDNSSTCDPCTANLASLTHMALLTDQYI
ncbi:unnamed protein product [Closterium sp. NIES-64]|nr:unnamed protein product [Closterium sp. NIES-64]